MKNRVDQKSLYTKQCAVTTRITYALHGDMSSGSMCAPYAEHTSGCTSMSSVSWWEPL